MLHAVYCVHAVIVDEYWKTGARKDGFNRAYVLRVTY